MCYNMLVMGYERREYHESYREFVVGGRCVDCGYQDSGLGCGGCMVYILGHGDIHLRVRCYRRVG